MIRAGIRRAFRLAAGSRRRWEREVEDEIKLHLALRTEQLMAQGTPPDDALTEAIRRFGPMTESRARLIAAARHRERRMQRTEYLADVRQDLAFALRTLRRQKAWAAITVATLALGVGATTAVFSVVSSLMLHMLPYPGGNRLAFVYQQPSTGNNTGVSVTIVPSAPAVRAWKAGARSFEALEGFAGSTTELRTTGAPATVNVGRIEPTFPAFAGQRPIVGRMFSAEEVASSAHVAVLGEGAWRRRFGGDSTVLGRAITLGDSLYTIVGVLPASLQWPLIGEPPRDVWLPLDLHTDKGAGMVIGRLRRGASPVAAEHELDSLYARATGLTGATLTFRTAVMPPAQRLPFRDSLILLSVAVGLVLLIACANVAHLLIARSSTRRRELAIRVALGAGRGRVFRQLLTESLLLTIAGTASGVLAGWIGLRAMVAVRPPSLDTISRAHLDGTTLGLAVGIAVVTGLLFGVLGSLHSNRRATTESLKAGSTRTTGTRARTRTLLVVSEMALSAALVVGASMLVRSVIKLQHAELGFEPRGLYAIRLTGSSHTAPAARGALLRTMASRLSASPEITSVALAQTPPSWRTFVVGQIEIEGEPPPPAGATSFIDVNAIGTGYFQTMGMRLVQGTGFTDTSAFSNQVIINAGYARKHWGGASPIGRRLRIVWHEQGAWKTIVGVANDAATSGPMSESSAPLLYTPAADSAAGTMLVRTAGVSGALAPVRALVRSLSPTATPDIINIEEQVARSIAAPRFVMVLLTVFTILALMLAAIGLYGVMAYVVAEQTREIGIRMALGATRSRIARAIVTRGIVVAGAGAAAGIAAAAWGTRLIEHQLYGVARSDPISFGAAIVVLLAAAVAACMVPTRRALAVDPMTAIRAD